jgi:hypothetical protein
MIPSFDTLMLPVALRAFTMALNRIPAGRPVLSLSRLIRPCMDNAFGALRPKPSSRRLFPASAGFRRFNPLGLSQENRITRLHRRVGGEYFPPVGHPARRNCVTATAESRLSHRR